MTKKKASVSKGSAAELARIFPMPKVLSVKIKRVSGEGEARVVRWEEKAVIAEALAIEQLGRVAGALEPISESLTKAPNFIALAVQHPEEIFAAVAQAIDWPVADVRLIHGADFVTLAGRLIEENKDFFSRLLGPLVGALLATAEKPGSGGSKTE